MLMLSLYIGIYYNILISWSFFYLFSSLTSSLPWADCHNSWNTASCRRAEPTSCTEEHCTNTADLILTNATNPSDEFFQ